MTAVGDLIRAAQEGDQKASARLIRENAGLIWSVVKRYDWGKYDTEDLYQLGCLGFLKAVRGFDPDFGTMFSTYAVPKIAGEIRRFLRDDGAIKVSRSLKEHASLIRQTRSTLTNIFGREPTIHELSQHTGLTAEEIVLAENATAEVESIHRESGEEGFTLENILTDTESEERMVERIALREAISQLPERERTVIQLRYFHGLTQDRVARVLSVSQVQISRIEKKAIQSLRERIE